MLEILSEIVLQILLEVLGEAVLLAFKRHFDTVDPATGNRRGPNPVFVFFGFAVVGVLVGAASLAAFPQPLSTSFSARLAILIFAPLSCGGLMHILGTYRRRRRRSSTSFASFLGGFAFALGVAAFRFWVLTYGL
jgi:hypothetical protein